MHRILLPASALLFLVLGSSSAGEDGSPWKPFLPRDAYGPLTERSIKAIGEAAKPVNTPNQEVEGAILRGYWLSAAGTYSSQLKKPDVPKESANLRVTMRREGYFAVLMEIYRNKAKGGEGIHADLQYQPKLKNQNGIEALIGALAAKKLSDENLAKVEKELPLLSYRIAVTANLTQYAAPQKGKERWNVLAAEMRDSALALAESAKKKNADGILKAADALQNTCTNCHREFKSK